MIYLGIVIILLILTGLVIWFSLAYKELMKTKQKMDAAWNHVNAQLKRRYDVTPKIIDIAKESVGKDFRKAAETRASLGNAERPDKLAKANQNMESSLKDLFSIAEDQKELKSDKRFLKLQKEVLDTEKKLDRSKKAYNERAKEFNEKINRLPGKIIAGILELRRRKYFRTEEEENKNE